MPNYVKVVIKYKKQHHKQIKSFLRNKNLIIDFNNILKQPRCLRLFNSPCTVIPDKQWDKRVHKRPTYMRESLHDRYLQEYGTSSWYDWRCMNWGTKWNAKNPYVKKEGMVVFETAWSCPGQLIDKLSKIMPHIEFDVRYADENIGGGNCGHYQIQDGQETDIPINNDKTFAQYVWNHY